MSLLLMGSGPMRSTGDEEATGRTTNIEMEPLEASKTKKAKK
jgi:hypothetical protein